MAETVAERTVKLGNGALYSLFVGWSYLELLIGWDVIIRWVYHHETLTTGLLAVGSAVAGAMVLHNQTTQSARFEARRVAARREAARLELPLALSAISAYAADAAKATKALLDQCLGESLPPRAQLQLPNDPPLPASAIVTLKEVAETAEPDEVRPLAILVADIQVQSSRLHTNLEWAGGEETLVARQNLEDFIVDCALLYARAGRLFAYARGAESHIVSRVVWHDLHTALFHFGLWDQRYDRIRDNIKRRSGNDEWSIVEDSRSARQR